MAALSESSGVSASPSSLENRLPSPAEDVQPEGTGSEFEAEGRAAAGGRGAEEEGVGPGALGMCALASRSFNVDSGRPLGQCGLLGLAS